MRLQSVAKRLALLLGIFVASAIQNALNAAYLSTASRGQFILASSIGVIMTGMNLVAWKWILKDDTLDSRSAMLVYLVGDWIGTFLGLSHSHGPPRIDPPR